MDSLNTQILQIPYPHPIPHPTHPSTKKEEEERKEAFYSSEKENGIRELKESAHYDTYVQFDDGGATTPTDSSGVVIALDCTSLLYFLFSRFPFKTLFPPNLVGAIYGSLVISAFSVSTLS